MRSSAKTGQLYQGIRTSNGADRKPSPMRQSRTVLWTLRSTTYARLLPRNLVLQKLGNYECAGEIKRHGLLHREYFSQFEVMQSILSSKAPGVGSRKQKGAKDVHRWPGPISTRDCWGGYWWAHSRSTNSAEMHGAVNDERTPMRGGRKLVPSR